MNVVVVHCTNLVNSHCSSSGSSAPIIAEVRFDLLRFCRIHSGGVFVLSSAREWASWYCRIIGFQMTGSFGRVFGLVLPSWDIIPVRRTYCRLGGDKFVVGSELR